MKNISFAFEMPHDTAYVGGIAFIINKYLENKQIFFGEDCNVSLIDYSKCNLKNKKMPSKVLNLVNAIRQKKMLGCYIASNSDSIIHMHTSIGWTLFKDLVIADYVKRKYNAKLVLSIHFADISKILSNNKIIRHFEIKTLKSCFKKIIFLSQKTREEFVACGIDRDKTEVLYTFHTYQNKNIDFTKKHEKLNLLFMGSIDKRKGILDLLTALKEINNNAYLLHICGQINDESIKDSYLKLIDELKENVIFHGYVTGKEKEILFEDTDVFVLPSYGEGMPIVIMEAMSKGCAVISTDVGAIGEIVKTQNGILINPGDVEALESALLFYKNDAKSLQETKKINQHYGLQFNLEENIKRLTEIYSKV